MKKLLPIILLLIGSGAGVGAGVFLRPPAMEMTEEELAQKHDEMEEAAAEIQAATYEYFKMNNQFVVPIVSKNRVSALVVVSLNLEVPAGRKDPVFEREPKLRDAFLQVMFDHANLGGFEGEFTNANNLDILRNALREVAQKHMGDGITDVLIMEIARQDY
jgi:flagellar basal body-associated protein FliL